MSIISLKLEVTSKFPRIITIHKETSKEQRIKANRQARKQRTQNVRKRSRLRPEAAIKLNMDLKTLLESCY